MVPKLPDGRPSLVLGSSGCMERWPFALTGSLSSTHVMLPSSRHLGSTDAECCELKFCKDYTCSALPCLDVMPKVRSGWQVWV